MCKSFNQAFRIEHILLRVKDDVPKQATIRMNPYDCIEEVLEYLCVRNSNKRGEIEDFERSYQAFQGKSIEQLVSEGVDVDVMINELDSLI